MTDAEIEQACRDHVDLAEAIARRAAWDGADVESFISAAYGGLVEACQKFNGNGSLRAFICVTAKHRIGDHIRSVIGRVREDRISQIVKAALQKMRMAG